MGYDTDFKKLIPPLSKEEYDLLKESILKDGCRDAILVWVPTLKSERSKRIDLDAKRIILDGHNRYEICKKNQIPFATGYVELKDVEEAKIWVIQNQLGRRNLTDYQRGRLTLELKAMIQEKAKKKQREGGKEKVSQKSVEPPIDTQKELAKLAGVSHDTIHKIEVIEKEAPPEIKEAVASGEISISKAYKKVRCDQKTGAQKKISKVLSSIQFGELIKQWSNATKDERKQFLRMRFLDVKDKLNRYRFSNQNWFSESEKEYYATDIDERTIDIILQFGVYYHETPRFRHRKNKP
jgi:hypothetical protein